MPAVSWPSDAEFLGLHQAVLRRAELFERGRQFAGAGPGFFEQPRVLDRDHRLIGKGLHEFDLALA